MVIKYPNTPVPTVDIKIDNNKIKMGFTDESKQLFVQVITSYSQNGDDVGQACCAMSKNELNEYINVLQEMHKQM